MMRALLLAVVLAACLARSANAFKLHIGEFGESMDDGKQPSSEEEALAKAEEASDKANAKDKEEAEAAGLDNQLGREVVEDQNYNSSLSQAQIQNLQNQCAELAKNAAGDVSSGGGVEAEMSKMYRYFTSEDLGEGGTDEDYVPTGALNQNCTNLVQAIHLNRKNDIELDAISRMEKELQDIENGIDNYSKAVEADEAAEETDNSTSSGGNFTGTEDELPDDGNYTAKGNVPSSYAGVMKNQAGVNTSSLTTDDDEVEAAVKNVDEEEDADEGLQKNSSARMVESVIDNASTIEPKPSQIADELEKTQVNDTAVPDFSQNPMNAAPEKSELKANLKKLEDTKKKIDKMEDGPEKDKKEQEIKEDINKGKVALLTATNTSKGEEVDLSLVDSAQAAEKQAENEANSAMEKLLPEEEATQLNGTETEAADQSNITATALEATDALNASVSNALNASVSNALNASASNALNASVSNALNASVSNALNASVSNNTDSLNVENNSTQTSIATPSPIQQAAEEGTKVADIDKANRDVQKVAENPKDTFGPDDQEAANTPDFSKVTGVTPTAEDAEKEKEAVEKEAQAVAKMPEGPEKNKREQEVKAMEEKAKVVEEKVSGGSAAEDVSTTHASATDTPEVAANVPIADAQAGDTPAPSRLGSPWAWW